MLMGADNCGIHHGVFVVGIDGQLLEHLWPYARDCPAAMPASHIIPSATTFRKVTPRDTRTVTVNNGFHKQTIILCRYTYCPIPPRQQILALLPLIVP
jgi:hypothetical protein